MEQQSLTRLSEKMPAFFDDFFRPWSDWFGNGGYRPRALSVLPAVNITEEKNEYLLSLAVPGMKKDDFRIDVDGDILTIASEKETSEEEEEKTFTRKEFNYASFSRSFTLPEEVNKAMIDARYEDGVLMVSLPLKEAAKTQAAQQITVK